MSNPQSQFAIVDEVLSRYGAGELDAARAAALLAPAYQQAKVERSERTAQTNDSDPDAASTPTPWTLVDVARQTGTISMSQYDALARQLTEGGGPT